MSDQWVPRVPGDVEVDGRDLNGVSWLDAPLPWRFHRCKPQTRGFVSVLTLVERCACGAIRIDKRGPWMNRNTRRRSKS